MEECYFLLGMYRNVPPTVGGSSYTRTVCLTTLHTQCHVVYINSGMHVCKGKL